MLDLSRNLFNASLPEELAQLSELRVIDMSENRLTGTVPSSLGTLSKMVELYAFIRSVSNHIASHRIASHRIASHRTSSHRIASQVYSRVPHSTRR